MIRKNAYNTYLLKIILKLKNDEDKIHNISDYFQILILNTIKNLQELS